MTAVKRHGVNPPVASAKCGNCPGQAGRVTGNSLKAIAWLWVAAIPWPSHAAVRVTPAEPSHGTSRISSTNISGAVSPSGTATVTM